MILTSAQHSQLVAHARDVEPLECCGFLQIKDNAVEYVVRGVNLRASAVTYELDHSSLLQADDAERCGYDIALYHSHLRTPAEPSPNDVRLAYYPERRYVIVSLAGVRPDVRAWWISDGECHEDPLELED